MEEHTRMAEPTKENKKKKGGGAKTVGIVALLAALFGGGGYFGLGIGNPNGGALPVNLPGTTAAPPDVTTEAPKEVTTAAEPETTTEDSILSIIVKADGLVYEGRSVTLAELEKAILSDFKAGKEVELTDDHGKEADFRAVETLLKQLTIPFTEK